MLYIATLIIIGLILLYAGGEGLVRGSISVSKRLNIPVIFIALTIVALGTSAPEIVVSLIAAFDGKPDIAIGNVVGSNNANMLLVLGLAAIITPVVINRHVARFDMPFALLVAIIFSYFGLSGYIEPWNGLVLIGLLFIYFICLVLQRNSREHSAEEINDVSWPLYIAIIAIIAGMAMLGFGADILIKGAVALATKFNFTEGAVATTIVAIGSSLPEVFACVAAARRSQHDIVIGNIVGSNILNIVAAIAIASLFGAVSFEPAFLVIEVPIMLVLTLFLTITAVTYGKIPRLFGGLFLLSYIGYLTFIYTG